MASSSAYHAYRVCLIGSGGVGTIASLVLTKSGQAHVTAVLRSKFQYVAEHGWDIESIDHGTMKGWKPHRVVGSAAEAAVEEDGQKVEFDYVVVCTKQLPDRNPVAGMIAPVMTAGRTTVVLIQNGIGIEDEIVAAWPSNTVVSSVSHIGSGIEEPNRVVQVGKDVSKMGVHYGPSSVVASSTASASEADAEANALKKKKGEDFVKMYNAGGAHVCEFVDDIEAARWEKLLWNGTFNTVCALTRTDVGEIQRSKGRESLLLPMMWEIWHIAEAAGHALPDTIVQWMAYRLPDDCAYRASMLLDLENSRPMELEVILGNPLKVARRLGVATPVMDVVYKLLQVEAWKIDELGKK
ncbi:hypothetical protein SEUCBS139899_001055 [Sporothrix eucalyptigena]|uniref:2-dehydropantoate 2-reductase n=1 Tax=Sporothrix eucalyptigena TaxID=1812306 RepID=A0ABP0B6S5_9PEZI